MISYKIFLPPQVKCNVIISIKHGIDLRLRNLGKFKEISKLHEIIAYCPVFDPQNENFINISIKISKTRYWNLAVRHQLALVFVSYILSRIVELFLKFFLFSGETLIRLSLKFLGSFCKECNSVISTNKVCKSFYQNNMHLSDFCI